MERKINWLRSHLPEGLVVDAAWLEARGYSGALRARYVKSGFLYHVARSVYRRAPAMLGEEEVSLRWQEVVISLQSLAGHPVIVGGRTALELHGLGHYAAPGGPNQIHLYTSKPLPSWVQGLEVGPAFVSHNAERLLNAGTLPQTIAALSSPKTSGAPAKNSDGLARQNWGQSDWPLILSSPERAILELLDELPGEETFHQADMLMEGLANLSPRKLGSLLADCRSVKVKRLFLWFGERHNHAWLKSIDRKNIDLGKGKRMLVRGGKFDSKFNITVPENLDAGG